MKNEIQVTNNFTQEKIELIKNVVAIGATDLELQFFIEQCKRTGLDPITRQIYFIKDKKGKVNIQTSIDGLRFIAERSDDYQGQTSPEWCGDDGIWKDVWLAKTPPRACKIGVYKTNFRDALTAVALFDEYAQKNYEGELNYIWGSKPALMLAKVAEALALRKAFPNDMSGIYTQDEYTPEVAEPKKEIKKVTEIVTRSKPTTPVVKKPEPSIEDLNAMLNDASDDESGFIADFNNVELAAPKKDDQHFSFEITFGKFKGKNSDEIPLNDLISYCEFLDRKAIADNKPLSPSCEKLLCDVKTLAELQGLQVSF